MIKHILIVGTGGFLGTALRYIVNVLCKVAFHSSFPVATFLVNIIGCLLIGLVFGLAEKTDYLSQTQVLLLATGFCGGFTTFSAFANETFVLGSQGNWTLSALYVLSSIVLGILAVWLGRTIITN